MDLRTRAFRKVVNRRPRFIRSCLAGGLNARAVVALIYRVSRTGVDVRDVRTFFLRFVYFRFFRRTGTTAFLVRVCGCPLANFLCRLRYLVRLLTAVATFKVRCVADNAEEVCARRGQFVRFPDALRRDCVFRAIQLLTREGRARVAIIYERVRFRSFFCGELLLRAMNGRIASEGRFRTGFVYRSTRFKRANRYAVLVRCFRGNSHQVGSDRAYRVGDDLHVSNATRRAFLLDVR